MATITITGLDEGISGRDIQALAAMHGIEVGFLYTRTPEGRNRYPSRDWLARALPLATGRAALHVCGKGARAELLAGDLGDLVSHAPRIQVNGLLEVKEVERICALYPRHMIITQHRDGNDLLSVQAPNHSLLVDASGGRGKAPAGWHRPSTHKSVGFAGGLGPGSLAQELPKIRAIATGDWWVDMEGRLRSEDWFDVTLAAEAIREFYTASSYPAYGGQGAASRAHA